MIISKSLLKKTISLKSKKQRDKTGLFLAYGFHLLEIAIKKKIVNYIVVDEKEYSSISKYVEKENIPVYQIGEKEKKLLFEQNCRILIVAKYFDVENEKDNKILVLDDIQDPKNLGSIIRTAVSFSYDAVFLSKNSVDKYHPHFIQSSQGANMLIKIVECDLIEVITKLKSESITIISTDLNKENQLSTIKKNLTSFALFLGNEGKGIRKEISDLADLNVLIDIDNINSINVGVASGILMYMLEKNE